jgi:glycosyltransferase involved in cell wall biosynthesis
MSGESEKKENVGVYTTEQTQLKLCIACSVYIEHAEDVTSTRRFLHELLKRLVNLGAEVHVVVPHREGLKKEEIIDDVYIHRFQYMFPSRFQTLAYGPGIPENIKKFHNKLQIPFFVAFMTFKLLMIIRKYDIDVVNPHWAIPGGFCAALTKSIHKKPILLTLYGVDVFPIEYGKFGYLKAFIAYSINKSDKVVGISDTTCEVGKEISGREDIEILPDGIDTERFNPNINGNEIREKYDLNDYFMIFSSGRMVERKGFRYLIEALPHVLEGFSNTKLIIGGDGPERENLENLVATLGLRENVIFPGFIPHEDFPKYMKACDVFILPAIIDSIGDTEGSATIMLETMACGTPVVGTKVGGIPYAIKNGMGGFLVEQKNAKQLANKIVMLIKDEELREKMSKVGRKYVEEKFSWTEIAEKYKNIFEMLDVGCIK